MNRDEQLALAERVASDFYKRVKYKVGRKAFNRIDLDELKQDAACFVLECFADEQMSDPAYCERAIINFLRRQTRQTVKTADRETELAEEDDSEDANPALIDPAPFADPSDRAAMNEVVSAVDALPEKQRVAITGHYLNGENPYHMAGDLAITPRAVYHRIDSGINSLRSMMRVA